MNFKIYTDGSCLGNPGAGGWAAVIVDENNQRAEISGGESFTTNNRMELTAAIKALQKIPQGSRADIFTDSSYLKNAFTKGWLANWKRNGWKTANRKDVENRDLWEQLDALCITHSVTFHKVKGHSDNVENNRCDQLATSAIKELLKQAESKE